jgi:hypothetical protein
MLSRKVGFFTRKPTKMDLHFYDFSTIFNDFSKVQLKTLKHIYRGTLRRNQIITKRPSLYGKDPHFTENTLERIKSTPCSPRRRL